MLSQQVEDIGLPRGGVATRAPQDIFTSTPVGRERLNFADAGQSAVVQRDSMRGPVVTPGTATPGVTTVPVQSHESLRRDQDRLARLRDAVADI